MKFERLPPILTTLQPSNHPYLNGAWTPLHEEVDAWDLDVIEGAIPTDIDGLHIRNTEARSTSHSAASIRSTATACCIKSTSGAGAQATAIAGCAPGVSRPSRRPAVRCGAG